MSHDTWLHRVARLVVRPLVHTAVTPNQLTTLRLLTGLGAAALAGLGEPSLMVWAAALFVVSMVLDRADGDLARLSGRSSPFGHLYDLVADSTSNSTIFVGIGVGVRQGAYGAWSVPMGLMAGVAVAAVLWLVMRVEELEGARGAELGSIGGFDADDAMLIVPIGLALGWAEPLLAAAALGAPLFALYMLWRFRKQLSRR